MSSCLATMPLSSSSLQPSRSSTLPGPVPPPTHLPTPTDPTPTNFTTQVALGILKRMGCTNVVTAEDGEAALEALHAAGGPDAFDVILMDLHMPKKVRGSRRVLSI